MWETGVPCPQDLRSLDNCPRFQFIGLRVSLKTGPVLTVLSSLCKFKIAQPFLCPRGFLVARMVKNLPANTEEPGSIPESERISWRKAWQPTPVFLPGEFQGQRSQVGYSP